MSTKANVQAFNKDALTAGSYQYTNSVADIAKRFSNSRTSRAIAEAVSFAGKSVLDVGCGDGTFTLELAGAGAASILGIDPATEAIGTARVRAQAARAGDNVRFAVFNSYDLTPAFGTFDIVVLRGVLHHLEFPQAALKAIASVCKEVVVIEPNGYNPVLKLIERLSAYHIQHEEQSFMPMTIDRWLKAAGKTPVKRQVVNLVPLFCHPILARIFKGLEPLVEAIPLLRLVSCGQYVVRAA